jgi:hypothetical protein
MSSAPLFLLGAVALATVGSLLVWMVSRPRRQANDPHEFRNTLKTLSRGHRDYRPTSGSESSGMRVLPDDDGQARSPDPDESRRENGHTG